jgi:FSR family fosmidomycin resistance protein-like MFS transporter
MDRRGLVALSAGHACADLAQGALPALLPFLIRDRGWSYTAVGALVLAMSVGSSIVQPLFGLYADRLSLDALIPVGVALSAVGIGLVGVTHGYGATLGAILLSGLGVAAFHPQAARASSYAAGARRATGMSVFSVGGNVGFALGPALTTPLVLWLGLGGTVLVAIPGLLASALLAVEVRRLERRRLARAQRAAVAAAAHPTAHDAWGPFVRLGAVVSIRSCVYFGLQAFLAAYFVQHLHASKGAANTALTLMLAAGAVATLVGGRLADRIGRVPVVVTSIGLLTPLLLLFLVLPQPWATVVLTVVGFMTIASFSLTVVMGQEYLPNRVGLASGVTLGFAIGVGGLLAPGLGVLADHAGPRAVMLVVALMPLPALALALKLPSADRAQRAVAEARRLREAPTAA